MIHSMKLSLCYNIQMDSQTNMIVLIQLKSIKCELGPVIELNANKNA